MLASLFNLFGPDSLILLFVAFLVFIGPLALIAFIVQRARHSHPATPRELPSILPVEQRLRRLDELKAKGLITVTEYQAQRQKILTQL